MKLTELSFPSLISAIKNQSERFFSHVEKTESCWIWKNAKDKDGYGKFQLTFPRKQTNQVNQLHIRSHRLSFLLFKGRIDKGKLVLHSCDNPACCNPDHLEQGTQKKNRQDACIRGRTARGEKHGNAILTDRDALEIIRLKNNGATIKELSEKYGLAPCSIHQVGRNTWKWLI